VVTLNFYKENNSFVNFHPLSIKRNWMDNTVEKHAYRCFPVSSANLVGWTFSYPEDIVFIWDGISDTYSHHVKILKGNKYVNSDRSNATISFNSNLYLRTEDDISIMVMPVPNQFIAGTNCFTTILSPSILKAPIPVAWMITMPNIEITIPANTPIASIIPISLKELENTSVNLNYSNFDEKHHKFLEEYSIGSREKVLQNKWSNFYRDGVDHNGNQIGKHEVKNLKLNLNDYTKERNE
jgi:hypothetical protein